ncbi:rod shape-determining protein RodA [Candidatus Uhrbacteria bacterium]|nr:rod shape-determining protein RodA [Candidatus Uhrbacteria bacterium]
MFAYIQKLKQLDILLLCSVVGISFFSIAALYSIGLGRDPQTFEYLIHQSVILGIGLLAALGIALVNYRVYRNVSIPLYICSVLLLLGVLMFGEKIRGTRGWFFLGSIGVQPAEIAKIALIMMLAWYFSSWTRQVGRLRHILVSGACMAVPFLLILAQPDFGSAVILFIIWAVAIGMSGIPKRYVISLGLILVVLFSSAWLFFFADYQKERIATFIFPAADIQGSGYNVRQARIAIGAGQLFGTGIGAGSQSQLKFLPETQTDFVYSVIAEELGFVGVFFLLLFWCIFFYRAYALLKNATDDFSAFIILGGVSMIFSEVAINIGGNLGLVPLTGIALPLISYGGSSLFVTLLAFGLLQSISIHRTVHTPQG